MSHYNRIGFLLTDYHSVMGIVFIPGMMTGAILGGSSVQQAARLQIVIMFMISASTALSAIVSTVLTLSIVIDAEDRIRLERIDDRLHAVWRTRNLVVESTTRAVKWAWHRGISTRINRNGRQENATGGEVEPLLR